LWRGISGSQTYWRNILQCNILSGISGAAGELRCGNETRIGREPALTGQLAIIAAIGNGRCLSEGYAMRIETRY
jgi:hypothetical protein